MISTDLAGSASADPELELYRPANGTSVKIWENDDWAAIRRSGLCKNVTGATGLLNSTSRDSALLVTLPPGVYTANVSGVNNTAGVVLLEADAVP